MCFYLLMSLPLYFICDHIPEKLQQIPTVTGYDRPME